MRSLSCCGKKQPKTYQETRQQLEKKYNKVWRFKEDELFEFTKRFQSQAVNHKLSHKNYRESLGIIGIESLSFMCDRMFHVMDKDKDGFITLEEYLNYTDVLLYGTEEDKLKQSFELLDEGNYGQITFNQFRKIVGSFAQMWSAALGQPTPINPRFIAKIFQTLSEGKEYFDLEDFKRAMKDHPDMLFWFSKPEEAMNKRLNDHLGKQAQKEQKLREKIETLKDKFIVYQKSIQVKLQQVIDIIGGVVTPQASKDISFMSSIEGIDKTNINFIQKARLKKMPVGNDLFMNLSHKDKDIEFPNDVFNSKSPKSQRIKMTKGLRKVKTKILTNKNQTSSLMNTNKFNHTKGQRSFGQLLVQNNQRNFDVIEEESPKMIAGEDVLDSSIGVSEPNTHQKKRQMYFGQDKSPLSLRNQQTFVKKKSLPTSFDRKKYESHPEKDPRLIPQVNRLSDIEDRQFVFPNHLGEDNDEKNESSIFERDSQSNLKLQYDDYQFEGGESEESKTDAAKKHQNNQRQNQNNAQHANTEYNLSSRLHNIQNNPPSNLNINQFQNTQTQPNYHSQGSNMQFNRTINEHDIELNFSKFDETRSLGIGIEALKDIHLQSNPHYPGQIFFVESPLQLELIQSQMLYNEDDDNSDSDSSDSSSNSSNSDLIGPSENERFEENFNLGKMDKNERALIQKIQQMQKYLDGPQNQMRRPTLSELNNITNRSKHTTRLPAINHQQTTAHHDKITQQQTLPQIQLNHNLTQRTDANKRGFNSSIQEFKSSISTNRNLVTIRQKATVACQTEYIAPAAAAQLNNRLSVNTNNNQQLSLSAHKNQESMMTFAVNQPGLNLLSDQTKHESMLAGPVVEGDKGEIMPELIVDDEMCFSIRDKATGSPQVYDKINFRLNQGQKMLHSLIKFINEQQELFVSNFLSMLIVEQNEDNMNFSATLQNQISQNIPKTLIKKRNRILKPNKSQERSNIPDNVKMIHPAHENFNLVFNIMLGIKKAIDSTLDIPLLEPTEIDFKIRCKHELAPFRTSQKDNIKACTFYDYAPQIFANIRKTCCIKKAQYSNSLGPEHILGYMFNAKFQTLAELCSSGKSGSFFYYTADGKFVLKTISRTEFKFLKRILKEYHNYLTLENNESIISKVFGLHKVIFYRKKHNKPKKVYFTIMSNVFNTHKKIDRRFDLKGSTQGRQTIKPNDPIQNGDPTIALKDLDFLRIKEKFKLEGSIKKRMMETIKKDAMFFAKNDIIDYSLLVGIHYKSKHSPTNGSRLNSEQSDFSAPMHSTQNVHVNQMYYSSYDRFSNASLVNQPPLYEMCEQGITSIEKSCVYFIGIIDILTEYNTFKKLEHALKSIKYNSNQISCVPPQQYANRFLAFINDAFQ